MSNTLSNNLSNSKTSVLTLVFVSGMIRPTSEVDMENISALKIVLAEFESERTAKLKDLEEIDAAIKLVRSRIALHNATTDEFPAKPEEEGPPTVKEACLSVLRSEGPLSTRELFDKVLNRGCNVKNPNSLYGIIVRETDTLFRREKGKWSVK